MKKHIRTFVGIKIGAGKRLLEQLSQYKELFKDERINWVDAENFHLTLRFIGNTDKDQLYELVDRFEGIAGRINNFSFEIKGTGYFKSKGQPRVLFVKIHESEELKKLAGCVEESAVEAGFHEELKPFRPHITLGRIKHLRNRLRFYSILDETPELEYQKVSVTEFIIYKSILLPDGPVYEPIRKFELL